jgi:hypothetical protein
MRLDRKLGATPTVGGRLVHSALSAPHSSVVCFATHSRLHHSQFHCSDRRLRNRATLIGCSAIRNRCITLKQHAMPISNRSRVACLRARFVLRDRPTAPHHSPISNRYCPKIRNRANRFTANEKYFLIATFSAWLARASRLAALTTLHPSPTMKSVPFMLQRIAHCVAAVADHGQLITSHHSLVTGLNYV